ncbi:MAG: hypothetical protein NTX88_06190 [Candidatus Atribacteria bacterium]|nr:hypothetical protein [Candidatus Atribacteria bacterium]
MSSVALCLTEPGSVKLKERWKLHLLLDHEGYLSVFALIIEGAVPEVNIAQINNLITWCQAPLSYSYPLT